MQTLRDVKEQAERNLKRIRERGGHDALTERDLRVMAGMRKWAEENLTPEQLAVQDERRRRRELPPT
jgi:hypothetical protein